MNAKKNGLGKPNVNNKAPEQDLLNDGIGQNNELRLKVAELYLDEWKNRDGVYHKFFTTFYFCAVVVSLFPYLDLGKGSIDIDKRLFLLCGSFIALVTSILLSIMSKRQVDVYYDYRNEIHKMKNEPMESESKKKYKLSKFIPWISFSAIFIMNLILFFAVK